MWIDFVIAAIKKMVHKKMFECKKKSRWCLRGLRDLRPLPLVRMAVMRCYNGIGNV
jgi:hypothetical protein